MADQDSAQEKTEEPTSRRKRKEREQGNVAQSQEVNSAIFLVGVLLFFKIGGGFMMSRIKLAVSETMSRMGDQVSVLYIQNLFEFYLIRFFVILAPFFVLLLILTFLSTYIQFGWLFTTKTLKLNWGALNFAKGFSKMLNAEAWKRLGKSVIKIIALLIIAYVTVRKEMYQFMGLVDLDVQQIYTFISTLVLKLLLNILFVFVAIAVGDLMLTRYMHNKKMKMSKSDIKEEHRQMEGDPQVRSRIRSLMMAESRKRMLDEVPDADVVITNPIHLACALKYDPEGERAPILVAKGKRIVAEKIKEIARKHDIPIVEDKPLARLLYKTTEVGQEISYELFSAVAEILAQVYSLKNKTL